MSMLFQSSTLKCVRIPFNADTSLLHNFFSVPTNTSDLGLPGYQRHKLSGMSLVFFDFYLRSSPFFSSVTGDVSDASAFFFCDEASPNSGFGKAFSNVMGMISCST